MGKVLSFPDRRNFGVASTLRPTPDREVTASEHREEISNSKAAANLLKNALGKFNKGMELKREWARLIEEAAKFREAKRYREAQECLENSDKFHIESVECFGAAENHLNTALSFGNSDLINLARFNYYYELGMYELCTLAAKFTPGFIKANPEISEKMDSFRRLKENPSQYWAHAAEVLKYFSTHYGAYLTLADALKSADKLEEAYGVCEAGLKYETSGGAVEFKLGQISMDLGMKYPKKKAAYYKQAGDYLSKAVLAGYVSAQLKLYFGIIEDYNGNPKGAEQYFNDALKIEPDNQTVLLILTHKCLTEKNIEGAKTHLEKILSLTEGNKDNNPDICYAISEFEKLKAKK